MDDLSLWLTVIIAALLSLGAIYIAVAPLLQPGRATPLVEDDRLVELLGRKDATLRAIKELEFDYQVGKMSQEDYRRHDQRLRRQAIGLMQQIEKVAPASATLDEQLESIIAQFRQTSGVRTPSQPAVDMPASIPTIDAPQAAGETRFCTECGKPVEPTHKFCANCGTPIAQTDAATQA
jgi:NADH pyrophosphatase NudC (nudix superfamily)